MLDSYTRITEMPRKEHAQQGDLALDNKRTSKVEIFKYLGTLVISILASLKTAFGERFEKPIKQKWANKASYDDPTS